MPVIHCDAIKEMWNDKKSVQQNMADMGICYDPNETIAIPNTKDSLRSADVTGDSAKPRSRRRQKNTDAKTTYVVDTLTEKAKKTKPKPKRLPKEVMFWVTYMLDKYGEDYEAMSRDPKNYYQDSPAQMRQKVIRLKNIPEQWAEYLLHRGMIKSSKEGTQEVQQMESEAVT